MNVGGLQKEGALLVISASRLAQTEPILQLYVLKGKTSLKKSQGKIIWYGWYFGTVFSSCFCFLFLISSPQLIEFQNNRASTKYQNVVGEMHMKFQERKEDSAIQLHEQLEQLEK